MKKIQVLMSTYNGEKYLKEQIESILNQEGVEVHLLVRDDGSKDNTLCILKKYKEIEVIEAQNVGSTESFLELIGLSGDYDFYAFADQDDVWDKNKLLIAIQSIQDYECPALYSGNTRLVDQNLKLIKNETFKPITTLGSAIVKNYVTGCTAVFNKDLMNQLKKYKPQNASFHDWWVNLVCLSVGGVSVYDMSSHISYRQHGNNVVSGNDSFVKKWKSRLNKFINYQYHRDLMALEILNNYQSDISRENLYILENIIHKKYIKEMTTCNCLDDLLFKICLLMGRI